MDAEWVGVAPAPRCDGGRRLAGADRWVHDACCRTETVAARRRAVERVIAVVREQLGEPLTLQEMARIAISSPYHFSRIFRQVTGLPPRRFLAALRIEAAKRLLVTTRRSVTKICFDVGYNSLGTFTTHFTHFVGVSPRQLRRAAEQVASTPAVAITEWVMGATSGGQEVAAPAAVGRIAVPNGFAGPAVVGFFQTPIPRGCPTACGAVGPDGFYRIARLPDGRYYAFAVGLERSADPITWLLHEHAVRGSAGPVPVRHGAAPGRVDIVLRPPELIDPPILIALPVVLFIERLASAASTASAA
jgi:AraC family transcriptional regulator